MLSSGTGKVPWRHAFMLPSLHTWEIPVSGVQFPFIPSSRPPSKVENKNTQELLFTGFFLRWGGTALFIYICHLDTEISTTQDDFAMNLGEATLDEHCSILSSASLFCLRLKSACFPKYVCISSLTTKKKLVPSSWVYWGPQNVVPLLNRFTWRMTRK